MNALEAGDRPRDPARDRGGCCRYGRRHRHRATLAEWAVGGRSLGALLFWFINAGEIYTTFAVLGISGYAWALGAPAYWPSARSR